MSAKIDESTPGAVEGPSPAHGPIRRVIAGSILLGAVAALALALGVFAGAGEATITGSVLLGWGLGWTALAALSSRMTRQPQTWAKVPAAAMAATGITLLAVRPGPSALSAIAWIWPAFVVGLVIWMHAHQRRSLPGRGRWLLRPVLAVLVLAAVGATYENVAAARDESAYPAPGRIYEVNGHRLHLDCHGHGGPTTVLFNGLGEVTASWAWITAEVAQVGRVCAYDRAGQGWSSAATSPQDAVAAANDLNALLAGAGESGPYVLVGHSTGGAFALTYAARYPDQVAGMVLLDSSSPEQFTRIAAYPGQYAAMRRGLAMTPSLWRLGVGRLLGAVVPSHLPSPAAEQVTSLSAHPDGARSMRDEVSVLPEVFAEAQDLTTLGTAPLAVVTASETAAGTAGWSEAQDQLAHLSANSVHLVVKASHAGLLEDRDPATEAAREIAAVIAAIRSSAAPERS